MCMYICVRMSFNIIYKREIWVVVSDHENIICGIHDFVFFFGMPILYVSFSYTVHFEKSGTVNAITYDAVNRYEWVDFCLLLYLEILTEIFIPVPTL